jgi:hypothetical protein
METRERSLLAEIIHDEPTQLIVVAAMRIDRLGRDSTDGEELAQIFVLLETSIERLRRLIVALAPPDLAEGWAVRCRSWQPESSSDLILSFISPDRCTSTLRCRLRKPCTGSSGRLW